MKNALYQKARAWCILEQVADDLGMDLDKLIRNCEDGNLSALIKAAIVKANDPNDISDSGYDLAMSVKAVVE